MSNFPNKTDLFFIKEFDDFANNYIKNNLHNNSTQKNVDKKQNSIQKDSFLHKNTSAQILLSESISYTLLSKTKRFRPLLIIYTAKSLGLDYKKVLPWALAIEMIHNFSLIHDDLPCMDNDDLRRGRPSNHKVFGEALALLSGNSLLIESFSVLVKYFSFSNTGETSTKNFTKTSQGLCTSLIKEIINSTGVNAMMLGQVGDLILDKKIINKKTELEQMSRQSCNELKTGSIIKAAVLGVTYIYQDHLSQNCKTEQTKTEQTKEQTKTEQTKTILENKLIDFSFYFGEQVARFRAQRCFNHSLGKLTIKGFA
ncbi:MAG: hypothetical protein HAW60_06055, partial [Bdellovibrionales bacterium]|nr:hypothetical protein [Bdellovibrionales bacterium]